MEPEDRLETDSKSIEVDLTEDKGHREPPKDRDYFSDWSDKKAIERQIEAIGRLAQLGAENRIESLNTQENYQLAFSYGEIRAKYLQNALESF